MRSFARTVPLALAVLLAFSAGARAGFELGDAGNFGVLYQGAGGQTLQISNNVTINGNLGIAGTGQLQVNGGVFNGNILFANTPMDNIINAQINGTVSGNNANVQADLTTLGSLSATLGRETGTPLAVNGSATIDAGQGALDANGNRVFSVSSFNFGPGSTLTINGTADDYVVLNFAAFTLFGGAVDLTGGISSDHVLFNVTGANQLLINTNNSLGAETGTFLDPDGAIVVANTVLDGRVFGGDSFSMQMVAVTLNAPPPPTVAVPEPSAVALALSGVSSLIFAGLCTRLRRRLAGRAALVRRLHPRRTASLRASKRSRERTREEAAGTGTAAPPGGRRLTPAMPAAPSHPFARAADTGSAGRAGGYCLAAPRRFRVALASRVRRDGAPWAGRSR